MANNAAQKADEAIYARLTGDGTLTAMLGGGATGGVHNTEAPHDDNVSLADFPVLVYQYLDTTDDYVLSGPATEVLPYLFKAAARESDNATVHAILDRVHVLLQDHVLAVSGYTTLFLRRMSRQPVVPITEYGVSYRQGSHRYLLEVQSL